MNLDLPILVLVGIAAAFAVFSVIVPTVVGPSRYNRLTLAAYECGIERADQPVSGSHAASGQRFPVNYSLSNGSQRLFKFGRARGVAE